MKMMNKISLSLFAVCLLSSPSVFAAGASQSASDASGSQSAAQMASQMMAMALMPQCMASPPNPMACTMMAQALAQAASLGAGSKGASDAAAAMSAGSGSGIPTAGAAAEPTYGGGIDGATGSLDQTAARSGLAKLGYSLSPDATQLTTPDGKTVSTAGLGSMSGAMAAGFSAGDASAALAKVAETQGKIASKFKVGPLEGGGEGGGGSGFGGSGRGADSNVVYNMGAFGRRRPAAANVSGMTKNFGGERIGVAGDDIFQMITRRYRSQDQANGFFQN